MMVEEHGLYICRCDGCRREVVFTLGEIERGVAFLPAGWRRELEEVPARDHCARCRFDEIVAEFEAA
jgi:hypothetical protein